MAYKLNYGAIFEDMQFDLIEKLKLSAPVHDADLRKSISAKIDKGQDGSATLNVYMITYWYFIENGTAPHWTSVDNLKKWAKDKLGDENLAYAIQKHIAKYGCFFGNSHRYKILTNKGYKSLKDIKIGELVLTHKKRFKKVTDKPIHKIGYKIPRYTIETESGNKVTVTEEHPFYCKRNSKFVWVKARDLKETDIILEVL
jgi:hypothetical protein